MKGITSAELFNCNDNQLRELFVEASRGLSRTAPQSPERTEMLWSMETIAEAMYERGR